MAEQTTDPTALMELLTAAFDRNAKRRECPVAKMLATLPEDVHTLVVRLFDNPVISTRKIHLALTNAGATVGRDALSDHRAKRCRCGTGGNPQ